MIAALLLAGALIARCAPTEPPPDATAPCACVLRTRDFVRRVDGLNDVQESSLEIARTGSEILDVALDLSPSPGVLEMRRDPVGRCIEMVGLDAQGVRARVGALCWDGPSLVLRWHRIGARRFAGALRAADVGLRTARIRVRLADGASCVLAVPTDDITVVLGLGSTRRVRVRDAVGLPLDLAVASGCGWRLSESPDPARLELASSEASLRIAYDPAMARLTVSWPEPGAEERARLRRRLMELRRELARRSGDEGRLIRSEIEAAERRLRESASMGRPERFGEPAVVEIRDPAGRACARVTIESR
jgi:hypothetical protein